MFIWDYSIFGLEGGRKRDNFPDNIYGKHWQFSLECFLLHIQRRRIRKEIKEEGLSTLH